MLHLFFRFIEVRRSDCSLKDYDPNVYLSEGDVALDRLSNPSIVRVHVKGLKGRSFL